MALTNSLQAYWKLDEASGSRADSHGSNTLTDNNTVTQAAGKIGNAAQFTRANSEYLSIADNAALSTGNIDFTVAAWVYLDSKPAGDFLYIATKSSTVGPVVEFNLYYNVATVDRFVFEIFNNPPSISRVATANNFGAASLGAWYHVVGWHDSVNDLVGISVNAGTANTTATSGTAPGDTAGAFELGRYGALASRYHNGRIDEVGFWKRVLTADERTALYNGGAGLAYPFATGGDAAFQRPFSPAIRGAFG